MNETITLSDNVHVRVNDTNRIAILKVGAWESFVQFDRVREITGDSPDVAMLRRLSEM